MENKENEMGKRSSTTEHIPIPTSIVRSVHQRPNAGIGDTPKRDKTPWRSATFFKAFFAGFKTYPTKESFPESKA